MERYFNPRAPRGARPADPTVANGYDEFQSTCPARGTTLRMVRGARHMNEFQSTCPARGTTPIAINFLLEVIKFQSTCPARGTTRPRQKRSEP